MSFFSIGLVSPGTLIDKKRRKKARKQPDSKP